MSLWRGGPTRREQGRDDLMERGIYGLEPVFGNHLKDMPMYKNPKSTDPILDSDLHSLPEFVVRCIQKIEKMGATTVGLYRVNGDNAVVQKIRYFFVNHNSNQLMIYFLIQSFISLLVLNLLSG